MNRRRIGATCEGWQCLVLAVAAAVGLAATPAFAAPCGGFTDVDDTNPAMAAFCGNVDWVKNRAVTLGCTSTTLYCPVNSVTRLQMAAFMNRLGTALTPVQLRADLAPGALDLDLAPVICTTGDFVATGFPRRAYVDMTFNGNATADVGLAADLVASTNGGATWNAINVNPNRGSVPANQWGGLSDIGFGDLDVGQTVRWGIRLTRGGIAGTADLSDSRCQLRALVYSRNGTAAPF